MLSKLAALSLVIDVFFVDVILEMSWNRFHRKAISYDKNILFHSTEYYLCWLALYVVTPTYFLRPECTALLII